MKSVKWTIECETLVATNDDNEAREQILNLFEGAVWGDIEDRELCINTFQDMKIVGINNQ